MKTIGELLNLSAVVDLKATNKLDALEELCEVISASDKISNKEEFYQTIIEREKTMSTGIGIGIAIPHVKLASIKDFVIAIGRKKEGLDFDSLDNKPVYLIIMIGANDRQNTEYLQLLSKIASIMKNEAYKKQLISSSSPQEIYDFFKAR